MPKYFYKYTFGKSINLAIIIVNKILILIRKILKNLVKIKNLEL